MSSAPEKRRFVCFFEEAGTPSPILRDPNYSAFDPGTVTVTLVTPAPGTTTYTYLSDGEVSKAATGAYLLEEYLTAGAGDYIHTWHAIDAAGGTIATVCGTATVTAC